MNFFSEKQIFDKINDCICYVSMSECTIKTERRCCLCSAVTFVSYKRKCVGIILSGMMLMKLTQLLPAGGGNTNQFRDDRSKLLCTEVN